MASKTDLINAQISWLRKISQQLDGMKESQLKTVNILSNIASCILNQRNIPSENLQDNIIYVSKFIDSIKQEREERSIEKNAYDLRRKYIFLWKKTLNDRKLAYYNKIRCENTAKVFEGFLERDPVFIPNKFKEVILQNDSQQIIDQKMELNIQKVTTDITKLKERATKYSSIVDKCENIIQADIISKCDDFKVRQKLTEIWLADISREEVKSKVIWSKKETWWNDLPHKPVQETPMRQTNQTYRAPSRQQENIQGPHQRSTPHQGTPRPSDTATTAQEEMQVRQSEPPITNPRYVRQGQRNNRQQQRNVNPARSSNEAGTRRNNRPHYSQHPGTRSSNMQPRYPYPSQMPRQEEERNFYEEPGYQDNFRTWSRNRNQRGDYYPNYRTRRNFLEERYDRHFPPLGTNHN